MSIWILKVSDGEDSSHTAKCLFSDEAIAKQAYFEVVDYLGNPGQGECASWQYSAPQPEDDDGSRIGYARYSCQCTYAPQYEQGETVTLYINLHEYEDCNDPEDILNTRILQDAPY